MFVVNTGRLACSCSAVSAALAAAEVVPPPAMTTGDRAPANIPAACSITAGPGWKGDRGPRPSRCGGHERRIHVVIDPLGRAHAADPFRAAGEQALVVQFLGGIT